MSTPDTPTTEESPETPPEALWSRPYGLPPEYDAAHEGFPSDQDPELWVKQPL